MQFKVMRVIWFFMMVTPLILGFVLFNNHFRGKPIPSDQIFQQTFVQVTIAASILLLALGGFIERRLTSPKAMSKFRDRELSVDFLRSLRAPKSHAPMYAETDIQAILSLPKQEQEILGLMGPYFTSRIIRHAFCESCATLGFITAFNTQTPQVYVPYAVAAIVGILMSMPKREELANLHRSIRS